MSMTARTLATVAFVLALAPDFTSQAQTSAAVSVLPSGSSFGEDRLDQPRRVFYSELIGGRRSAQSVLGDLLFEAPSLFGGAARNMGISCGTCHVQGTTNTELFIPGLSSRPGTLDPAGPIFNPKTNIHALNALTVPSLRGARFLAPFGHDGRFASLRDFARNAIVNEFAGPEPSPSVLDALVAFMQDLALLPNPRLGADSRITAETAAERRGEATFNRSFPNSSLSCASCHIPSGNFVDHQQHDVGTGLYKTPTLRNANFNAPYFHDGRFDTYDQVVDYFDGWFNLGLTTADKGDLVAYLKAVGNGEEPLQRATPGNALAEIKTAAGGLREIVRQRDWSVVLLAADGLAHKVHAVQRFFAEPQGTASVAGAAERAGASAALGDIVVELLRLQTAAEDQDSSALDQSDARVETLLTEAAEPLKRAEPWSLFNPDIMARHRQAMSRLDASGPRRKDR
jgi:cytochrome c peroxidase